MNAPRTTPSSGKTSSAPRFVVLGVVVALLAVIAFAVGRGDGQDTATDTVEVADVSVQGRDLPAYTGDEPDPAAGQAAPAFTGVDFDGQTVAFTPGERPAVLVFLAHWCPHCQAELPELVPWLEGGGAEGVDVIAVSTGVDPAAPNYPPSSWFEEEAWPAPVVVDDDDRTLAGAYGLPGYPYFVFVDRGGMVAGRISGALGTDQIEQSIRILTAGGPIASAIQARSSGAGQAATRRVL